MKFNPEIEGTRRKERENLRLLMQAGGQMMSSKFVEGHKARTKRLPIPVFCEEIPRWAANQHPRRVQKLFNDHPRCQSVISITNMRAAKRLLAMEAALLSELEDELELIKEMADITKRSN